MPSREWRFSKDHGSKGIAISRTFEINDALAAIEAAEMGHGITMALSYMVHDKVRENKLVPILDDSAPPSWPVHLVYPQTRIVAPKVRAFMDFAAPRLKAALDQLLLASTAEPKA